MNIIINNRTLDFSNPHVMGILNVTPDSFFDGGRYNTINKIINHVSSMINDGASIIDIGGESTRPGSDHISVNDELDRVIPVILELQKRFDTIISVNTSKTEVIKESILTGVNMINSIYPLDGEILKLITDSNLLVCLMHIQGTPKNMQVSPYYSNLLLEISEYFNNQIKKYEKYGIKRNRIILDPGFGFGKSLSHNYTILSKLSTFSKFRLPLLVGISHKSMITKLIGAAKSLYGSITCAVIAAINGANIIRVHDVAQTVAALKIVKATLAAEKLNY
ncbi:MAG: dihydropteroate synthase [Candidatus Lightella neohaematopini]|nr:dihydropteroate synthase [Candidatus Lightella neohaematopini]